MYETSELEDASKGENQLDNIISRNLGQFLEMDVIQRRLHLAD